MQKRGQIYILAVIILGAVVFVLALKPNIVIQEILEGDFDKLSSNYDTESAVFINSLINTDENISSSFFNFTLLFSAYSKAQNPNFELIYAFGFEDSINIGNFLSKGIIIDDGSNTYLINGCFDDISAVIQFQGLNLASDIDVKDIEECLLTIPYKDTIWVGIEGFWYKFEIPENNPQIMIVSQLQKEEQRQVFVGGEGFKKEDPEKDKGDFCNEFSNQQSCENQDVCCWEAGKGCGVC